MAEPKENRNAEEISEVVERLNAVLSDMRAVCQVEGLLSTYEEVHEYFLGKEAYIGYSLRDWLRDAKFRYEVLRGTWEYYRISLVMAHVASAKVKAVRGEAISAKKLLHSADMLKRNLRSDSPSVYVDSSIQGQRPSQRGGFVKALNRRCKSVLNCLEANHRLDGKDFKSFDEAVIFAVDMLLAEEQIDDAEQLGKMRESYPILFKDWLRLNAEEAARFEEYTGIAWND